MVWENSSYFNCRSYYYDSEPATPLEEAYRQPKFYDFNKAKEYDYKTSRSEPIHPTFKISRSSSEEDFKKKYRELILEHHPDKENGCHDKFIEIQEAWENLSFNL